MVLSKLHVEGKYVKDETGNVVILRGVNHAGYEYDYNGDWRGAGATWEERVKNNLDTMKNWGINCLRLPFNQGWWRGLWAPPQGVEAYRTQFDYIIAEAEKRGIYVILDKHWYDTVTTDVDYEHVSTWNPQRVTEWIDMWKDIAIRYSNSANVLFDLFNEPHSPNWDTWRYNWYPDMQNCINAIRDLGVQNIIIVESINSIDQGLARIKDFGMFTGTNLVLSHHPYDLKGAVTIDDMKTVFDSQLGYDTLKTLYPISWSECGIDMTDPAQVPTRTEAFKTLLTIGDEWGISYQPWNWCPPQVMSDYYLLETYFTPSIAGSVLMEHIAAVPPPSQFFLIAKVTRDGTPLQGITLYIRYATGLNTLLTDANGECNTRPDGWVIADLPITVSFDFEEQHYEQTLSEAVLGQTYYMDFVVPLPPPPGYLQARAYYDTAEVAASVEVVGIGTYPTPLSIEVPPGTYTLNATYQEQTQTQTANVLSGQTTTVQFNFTAPPTPPPTPPPPTTEPVQPLFPALREKIYPIAPNAFDRFDDWRASKNLRALVENKVRRG